MDRYAYVMLCCAVLSHFSCVQLCNPMDCSQPGSSVHGVLQTGILEWVAMPSSSGSSWPRNQTRVSYVSCIGRWVLYQQSNLGSPYIWYIILIKLLFKKTMMFHVSTINLWDNLFLCFLPEMRVIATDVTLLMYLCSKLLFGASFFFHSFSIWVFHSDCSYSLNFLFFSFFTFKSLNII